VSGASVPLRPETLLRRRPHVLSRQLDGEAVLLDPVLGEYFSVNPVGAAVWSALADPISLGALHALVLEQFAATPEVVREDLDRFVHELEQRGLIEIVER